ncbi:MAG TPA: TIGR02680 family protein [Longimicrobium sp.]|nr:TIGR02680 family protein [Longimicrobium sp.]
MQTDIFRLSGTPTKMLELLDAMHAGDPDRWMPRRLILQNYWLFEEPEVFHFARGNLMLTGQNESGKSTVLVTVVTLVLDMVLTPDRVDTMGSNDRSIRYYLIGKDDATEDSPYYHRERTAYVALEFERGNSGEFKTIGIGLRCSRDFAHQKVDRWGFVIHDGRRVEIDFHLHNGGQARRPFRESELRDRLGGGGQVFTRQQDYCSAVNETLYGFQTLDDYERLLDILHVVRTPKLGEGLNPKRVETLLKESLPPIPRAAVESASEVFQRLDTIEAELERLGGQISTAAGLERVQEAAVLAVARQSAVSYREALKAHRDREEKYNALRNDLDAARAEVARLEGVRQALMDERSGKQGRLDGLREMHRTHGAFDVERQLADAKAERAAAEEAWSGLKGDRRNAQRELESHETEIGRAETQWKAQVARLRERIARIAAAADQALWPSLARRARQSADDLEMARVEGDDALAGDLARSSVDPEAAARRGILAGVLAAHDALAKANQRHDEARKASDVARREYNAADDRWRAATQSADTARATAETALVDWRAGLAELPVTDADFGHVITALHAYEPQGCRPAQVLDPLQPAYDDAAQRLREHREELGFARRRAQDEAHEVEARLRKLSSEKDLEPERTAGREAARRLLREHGVPHAPLFAVCDLGAALLKDASLAARVEAGLMEAGLLDALVVPAYEAERVRILLHDAGLGERWIQPVDDRPSTGGSASPDAWLVPVAAAPGLAPADVRAALHALGLAGAGEPAVDGRGGWRLGPVHGTSTETEAARVRYLGETNRREERRRRIEEARARLAELREALADLDEQIDGLRARESTLAREWKAARELAQLQALHDRLGAVKREADERERRRDAAEMAAAAVENAAREVQEKAHALDRATDTAPYLKNRARAEVDAVARALDEVVRGAEQVADDAERLGDLRRAHRERAAAAAGLRQRIEELAPRIAQADARVQTLDARISVLEEDFQRSSEGREKIAAEIQQLDARLKEIDAAEREADRGVAGQQQKIKVLDGQEGDYRDQLRTARIRLEGEEFAFRKRIEAYPSLDDYRQAAADSGTEKAMYLVLDRVDPSTVNAELEKAREELQAAYLEARGTFEEMSPALDGDLLRFSHPDREMRLDELYRSLEDERARKETLLEEADRQLIEQLMLREVVDAIRDAIRKTRHWIDAVNRTLGGMSLFKDGVMRLHWAVRTREAADAFDPRQLDDLLSKTGMALDEPRRAELLEIFRTMVADIRRRNRDNELDEDYRTALLRMMDYTQWYNLTVQRRDEQGRWMPLTRKLYGQGSGGRRTLDLLLPLVAAVSARLESAKGMAPRLIGFDEAFAGVDDRNAAEIYGLLTLLNLNWIMATEKSTSINDKVRGSATYELLTDGRTVAPTLSLWDGTRRYEFVGDELLGIQVGSHAAAHAG